MFPEICRIPVLNLPVNSYGMMILLGFFAALFVGVRRGKTMGVSSELIADVGIYSMIVGIIGAKFTYLVVDEEARSFFDFADGNLNLVGAVVGGLVPYAINTWALKRSGKPGSIMSFRFVGFLVVTLLAALLGARLFAVTLQSMEKGGVQALLRDFGGGFVLYGGIIVGVAMGILVVRMRGERVLRIGDLAAPCMMLGLAIGRFGCLLNGCCWGKPTDAPWGVCFPPGSAAYSQLTREGGIDHDSGLTVALHPTQVYESLAAFAIFLILSVIWRRRKQDGIVLASLGLTYPAWRFIAEFLRGDNPQFWFWGMTFSQGISLFVFAGCLGWMFFGFGKKDLTSAPDKVS